MLTKPISEMTDAEREQRIAQLRAELDKTRHDAPEPEIVPGSLCSAGAIGFMDGRFYGVSDGIDQPWTLAERWLDQFFAYLPERHRLEYWRERLSAGATALTLFFESQAYQCVGAGFINPEICGDGEPGVFAPVMTNGISAFDLSDLARIAESTALRTGARAVHLWTPEPCTTVPGYRIENAYFGQMQVARIRPIQ